MSIADWREKFKPYQTGVFFAVSLIVVGLAAFGLGRLSVGEASNTLSQVTVATTTNQVVATDLVATVANAQSPSAKEGSKVPTNDSSQFVASKNGKKYFPVKCPAAKRIKEINKIFFADAAEATKAGYTLAGNCPGF